MYYYILGCGIACLVLFGINSMDTVCVKPAEILGKVILWPVALMEAVVRYSSTHHNIKTAPDIAVMAVGDLRMTPISCSSMPRLTTVSL